MSHCPFASTRESRCQACVAVLSIFVLHLFLSQNILSLDEVNGDGYCFFSYFSIYRRLQVWCYVDIRQVPSVDMCLCSVSLQVQPSRLWIPALHRRSRQTMQRFSLVLLLSQTARFPLFAVSKIKVTKKCFVHSLEYNANLTSTKWKTIEAYAILLFIQQEKTRVK